MVIHHGGARQLGPHWRNLLDFSASINPLGPAPGVRDAIVAALDEITAYPDPYASSLTEALAEHWAIDPDSILTGNGATDLIHFLARVWTQTRTTLLVPTFSEFHRAYPDATLVSSDPPDDGLLVLTNPNNPTGRLEAVAPRSGPVLADESFLDFTDEPPTVGATLRLRSLTKFHAIPGLRVGALIGPPSLIHDLRQKREPWTVNVLAEAAILASLKDTDHASRTRSFVQREAARLYTALRGLPGVHPEPPSVNYVFARLDYAARDLHAQMLAAGIAVRVCTGMPGIGGEAVRVAVRTGMENDRLVDAWRRFTTSP